MPNYRYFGISLIHSCLLINSFRYTVAFFRNLRNADTVLYFEIILQVKKHPHIVAIAPHTNS